MHYTYTLKASYSFAYNSGQKDPIPRKMPFSRLEVRKLAYQNIRTGQEKEGFHQIVWANNARGPPAFTILKMQFPRATNQMLVDLRSDYRSK